MYQKLLFTGKIKRTKTWSLSFRNLRYSGRQLNTITTKQDKSYLEVYSKCGKAVGEPCALAEEVRHEDLQSRREHLSRDLQQPEHASSWDGGISLAVSVAGRPWGLCLSVSAK